MPTFTPKHSRRQLTSRGASSPSTIDRRFNPAMSDSRPARSSHWPHRLAIALALVTFPLIWVGGLVTTYDAGMAVPDWPGTYGYNLFAYPLSTWIAGPWDLFIEHGHRLLGALAGIVAIGLVAIAFRTERSPWLRGAAIGALVLVIFQGMLGGARVLLDQRLVALIHGCVGPLFFAYLAGMIVITSPAWRAAEVRKSSIETHLVAAAWIAVALAYLQLVLGAVLRHIPLTASSQVFRMALLFHLVIAAALLLHVIVTASYAWRVGTAHSGLRPPSLALPLLVVIQVGLGIGTYVVKYSWPAWLGDFQFAAAYVVQEKSLQQSLITTAHVATGSLILFVSVLLAMSAGRGFFAQPSAALSRECFWMRSAA
jgi:heme a synthase